MKSLKLLSLILIIPFLVSAQQDKPNIIFIMADDMGFSDIGSYGSEIKTPNIDRLAEKGVRLKQFYNTGRCCPTRASLLTGQYSHNAGMGYMTGFDQGVAGYKGDLNKNNVTIAEALKHAGYDSFMCGKWHVCSNVKPKGPQENWPLQRGFERYFGTLNGSGSFFTPKTLTSGNKLIKAEKDFYYTDAISDSASTFINDHVAKKDRNPFFLYVAYTAPHWPLHAKEEDIKKYIKIYEKGWDELRNERYKKQLELGVIDKKFKLSNREDSVPAWNSIPKSERPIWVKRMATYAAQIDCMDQGIGRIMATLDKNKLTQNTMIVFMSDNGGCAEHKSTMDPSIDKLGSDESFESYRGNWANLSNTPFRLYKTRVHEGGIHTPFIVSWPGHTAKNGSVIDNEPAHIIDLMPTFLAAAGAKYPETNNGYKINPFNGKSLISVFKGEKMPERALFWEHQANRAIRYQDWKLVSKSSEIAPYVGEWELYNLKNDKTELKDLAKLYPGKVKELENMWTKWANENNVFPLNGTDLGLRKTQFERNL